MFTETLYLTTDYLGSIKKFIAKCLPEVKSSYRIEAVARNLGFNSNAAMLVAARAVERRPVNFNPNAFVDFLNEREVEVALREPYRIAAHLAILSSLDANHRLSMFGLGFSAPQRTASGNWENSYETFQRFQRQRKELLEPYASDEFLRGLTLLNLMKPTRTVRDGTGSYRLKHMAEKMVVLLPNGEKVGPDYVSNGVLITAAIYKGFKYKTYYDPQGYDHINVNFNMSKPLVDDLDCEIRPNGGFAQDRKRRLGLL